MTLTIGNHQDNLMNYYITEQLNYTEHDDENIRQYSPRYKDIVRYCGMDNVVRAIDYHRLVREVWKIGARR